MPEENKSVEEKAPVTIDTDPIQDDNIEIRPLKRRGIAESG